MLIPNESQMTCNVLILGSVLRLNIFEMVDMESPDSFARRYSLHPWHCINYVMRCFTSTKFTS